MMNYLLELIDFKTLNMLENIKLPRLRQSDDPIQILFNPVKSPPGYKFHLFFFRLFCQGVYRIKDNKFANCNISNNPPNISKWANEVLNRLMRFKWAKRIQNGPMKFKMGQWSSQMNISIEHLPNKPEWANEVLNRRMRFKMD